MADRVIYGAGGADEESEAERRRRGAHTPSDSFARDEYGDITEPNPEDDGAEGYRDAAGRRYGYNNEAEYGNYNDGGDGTYGVGELSDFDRDLEGIALLGDLSGANARAARRDAEIERRRRAAALGELAEFMPNANDLAVTYAMEDSVGDTTAEGEMARSNWREWAAGGLTDTDRAMMEDARRSSGRAARADREATMSAMEARGMGGSGAEMAGMLAAGEGAADRNASMDANMMGAAQQRQIAATDSLADWAGGETSYARGLEGRNTDRENMTRESRSEARQQAHENRAAHTAMSIGMNPYGGRDPNAEEDESDEAVGGLMSGIADWFS